jgi:hypothetical protein
MDALHGVFDFVHEFLFNKPATTTECTSSNQPTIQAYKSNQFLSIQK